ncbi:MAG: TIGR02996 domain-containing protein [Gemmataceae bacterium]|nr:TIGR02996 domain-containing protein [Gemmataceae bacterium]
MDQEAAILAAVAANPSDDLPRLAYADWLDDHAADRPDPEAARVRAEFIRVQCEIKRHEHLSSPELQRYADLYRRQDALLTNHHRDLLGPLGDDLGPHAAAFSRGFVTELRLDVDEFVRHADHIAALAPIPEVMVSGVAAGLDALSDVSHHVARITTARAQSRQRAEPVALTPADVWSVFVECWPWDRLRELDLEGCRIGDDGVNHLIAVEDANLPVLKDLDLSGNGITDEGGRSVVGSWLWTRLDRLVLGGNPLTDGAAAVLADAAEGCGLSHLNLRFSYAMSNQAYNHLVRVYGDVGRTKLDIF